MPAKLTNGEIKQIQNGVRERLEPRFYSIDQNFKELRGEIGDIHGKIDFLASSVDEFLHAPRRHDDEIIVLRAQTGRIRDVLVEKGVATESELSVLETNKQK